MLAKYERLNEFLNKEFDVTVDKDRKGKTCGYTTKFEGGFNHYYIKVKFYDTGEEKYFYFPDQFRFHLEAVDKKIQSEIIDIINQRSCKAIRIWEKPEKIKRRILFGAAYGKNSRDIYVQFCNFFDWEISKKGYFGMNTLMYAKNCTPEGYSVWFIPHNDRFEKFNENYHWFNFVKGNVIEEIWLGNETRSIHNDWSDRVTFIKTKEGYAFYGIYRPQEIVEKEINNKVRKVKIYKQFSMEYSNY